MLALATTAIVGVVTGQSVTILLGFGLLPIAWAIASSAYEFRAGIPVSRSAMRSVPLFLIGIAFCALYVLFALHGIGRH